MNIEQRVARLEALQSAHDANHDAERRAIDIAATEVNRRIEGKINE